MNLSQVSWVPQYAHADFARLLSSEPSKLTRDTQDTQDTRGAGPLSFPVLGIATNTQTTQDTMADSAFSLLS